MGVADVNLKKWLENKERFADLFNGTVFKGENIVKPEALQQISVEQNLIVRDKNNKRKAVQRFRDIIMNWHGTTLVILALENQENVSYIMPVRNMIYDGLAYMEQINGAWNNLSDEEKAKVSKGEFTSKYRKEQKLNPVITIVFYYGREKWDGAKNLYDMLDVEVDSANSSRMKKYIPNYRINLIDTNDMKNIKNFQYDLQMVFGMLKYKKDKKKLREYAWSNAAYFGNLEDDDNYAIATLLGEGESFAKFITRELKNNERDKEVPVLCKAIDDIYKDGVKDGKREGKREGRSEGLKLGLERGEKRGEKRGRSAERMEIAKRLLGGGMALKQVVSYTGITKKEKELLVSRMAESVG